MVIYFVEAYNEEMCQKPLKIQVHYSIGVTIIHVSWQFKKHSIPFLRNIILQQKFCIMQYFVFVQASVNLILYQSFAILPVQKSDLLSIGLRSLWSPS